MSGDRVTNGQIATDVPHRRSASRRSLASDLTVMVSANCAARLDGRSVRGSKFWFSTIVRTQLISWEAPCSAMRHERQRVFCASFLRISRRNGNCDTAVMRRAYREVLMSVGSVVILLLTLTAFDVRVREEVSRH